MDERILALTEELQKPSDSLHRVDILNELAWLLRYENTRKAMQFSKKALTISGKIEYPRGKAYARLHQSITKFLLSEDDDLLNQLLDTLKYFEAHEPKEKGLPICLNFLARVYESYGDYELGLEYAQKALAKAEEMKYLEGQGDILSNMGLIFSRISDFERALEMHQRSLSIRKKLKNSKAIASSMNLIARVYSLMGDYQHALEYYHLTLELRVQENDISGIPWTHLGIASVKEKSGDLEAAAEHYQKGLELNKKAGEKRLEAQCLLGLGRIYTIQKKIQNALENLQKALEISLEIKAKPLIYEVHLALSRYYEMADNYKKALEHHKAYQLIEREVISAEGLNKLKNQQIKFEVEQSKKEAEIHLLKHVKLKKAYSKLESQRNELEKILENLKRTQEQLIETKKIAALGSLVVGVAHEINTPVGISITAASSLAEQTRELAELYKSGKISKTGFKEYLNAANQVSQLILSNMERTAALIQSFKRVSVDQASEQEREFLFKNYLEDIVHSYHPEFEGKDIAVSIICDESLKVRSYPGTYAQILSNLLSNSIIHGFRIADRGNITITASRDGDVLEMEYKDDGTGIPGELLATIYDPFITSDHSRGPGLGLYIIYNLVTQKLKGRIQCKSSPGSGTIFKISIPSD